MTRLPDGLIIAASPIDHRSSETIPWRNPKQSLYHSIPESINPCGGNQDH
eukprot:m.112679 g.112679  ORF g.112679 m.112679 type:complete len:50 (-) comp12982_c0_seq1:89-238(-)